MFVLKLKNPMIGFPEYAGRREGRKIYFEPLDLAKMFRTETEAREWAGTSISEFNIISI